MSDPASPAIEPNGASSRGPGPGREVEWARRFVGLTLAWLAFETVSGLALSLLPFSVPNQWAVLAHTAVGLLFFVPVLAYQWQHLRAYWSRPQGPVKWMGYLATTATLVAIVSGLVLTAQALWASRISYGWSRVHLLSTYALLALALPHVLVVALRDRAAALQQGLLALRHTQVRAFWRAATGFALMLAPIGVLWALYPGERLDTDFPSDYSFKYGHDRPFAPSLATTSTGRALDSRALSGSSSCGTSGCHEEIAKEWSVSAHRWSAMDPAFQRVQGEMAKQNGAESTRYCGGCHDPISLFSGTKNIFTPDLTNLVGYKEGVSCLSCHSVRKTDVKGNANFVVASPSRYLFELRDGRSSRLARDFLIRAYPRQHVKDLSKRLFKTPEYCAACHKQFIDAEVNNVGWVQLQNQYDNWKNSRWNHPGDAAKTIECRECHMPLVASHDPAAGDSVDYNRSDSDGKHRSHRFVGANQAMPVMLKLPGGEEQSKLVERWLRGDVEIPEIASKWSKGPAVALELVAPKEAPVGVPLTVRAVITSNKVGHDFPTGPLDIIQAWVEITVTDESGRVVFASGRRDEKHRIEPGTFMFKAEPVDQYGNLIDRHNLWEMVGVRYRRSLFPGFSDTAEYSFQCSGSASRRAPRLDEQTFGVETARTSAGELTVTARLMYRKIDQFLLNFLFGESAGLTTPVTEMARADAHIHLVAGPSKHAGPSASTARLAAALP